MPSHAFVIVIYFKKHFEFGKTFPMIKIAMMKTIFVAVAIATLANGFTVSRLGRPAFARFTSHLGSSTGDHEFALLFDCDGVIIETEELHRLAYNAAFKAADLSINGEPVEWSVQYYDILQNTVGGGKPKMFFHFRNTTGQFPMAAGKPAPETPEEQQALIDALQAHKTEIYRDFIEEKAVARPGVIELMDEALADPRIAVGVCSASTKEAVTKVLDVTLGAERRSKLNVCILGDDVEKKKPDPQIYNFAADRIGIDHAKCVVIEDSLVGLRAAKAAVGFFLRCLHAGQTSSLTLSLILLHRE
jgi:HAD superfamily hydrolase (TIGR01509 family)